RSAHDSPAVFAEATFGSFATTRAHAGAAGALLGGEGLLVLHGARGAGDFSYAYDPLPELDGNPLEVRLRENNQSMAGGALLEFRRELARGFRLDSALQLTAVDRGLAGTVDNPTADAHESSQLFTVAARAARHFEAAGDLELLAHARRDALLLQGGPFTGGAQL